MIHIHNDIRLAVCEVMCGDDLHIQIDFDPDQAKRREPSDPTRLLFRKFACGLQASGRIAAPGNGRFVCPSCLRAARRDADWPPKAKED
jgi:hypothetical protein